MCVLSWFIKQHISYFSNYTVSYCFMWIPCLDSDYVPFLQH